MGKARRALVFGLLVATLATLLAPPASASTESERLNKTRRELRAARSKLAALRRTDAELLSTIRRIQRQLEGAKGLLAEAQETLAAIDARIRSHERQIAKLTAMRGQREATIGRRIAALYMAPGIEAEALMSAGDFASFVERSNVFDFVLRADRLRIEDFGRVRERERRARRELQLEADRAQVWRRRVSERVSLVWDALSTHKQAEGALADRIAEYRREVAQLEAEQRRIEDLIYSRGSFSRGRVSLKGFQWPTRGRRITSGYGRRWGGRHTGIDIDCSTGEAIYAAKAGRVIASEWGGGYGRMIIVDHGNGVSSLYAHLSRQYVGRGASVERGRRIGGCGSTGNSTGSHLHFEIRVNGKPVNPRPYLP